MISIFFHAFNVTLVTLDDPQKERGDVECRVGHSNEGPTVGILVHGIILWPSAV